MKDVAHGLYFPKEVAQYQQLSQPFFDIGATSEP